MKLIADPGIVDVVFFFQLVDNALADIAVWSDVVGKDSNFDAHFSSCNCRYKKIFQNP
jgi:hypothetical protein